MKHHAITPTLCEALLYGGNSSTHHGGNPCTAKDGVEIVGQHRLCWTHRKVVELRGVSVEKVLRGER